MSLKFDWCPYPYQWGIEANLGGKIFKLIVELWPLRPLRCTGGGSEQTGKRVIMTSLNMKTFEKKTRNRSEKEKFNTSSKSAEQWRDSSEKQETRTTSWLFHVVAFTRHQTCYNSLICPVRDLMREFRLSWQRIEICCWFALQVSWDVRWFGPFGTTKQIGKQSVNMVVYLKTASNHLNNN